MPSACPHWPAYAQLRRSPSFAVRRKPSPPPHGQHGCLCRKGRRCENRERKSMRHANSAVRRALGSENRFPVAAVLPNSHARFGITLLRLGNCVVPEGGVDWPEMLKSSPATTWSLRHRILPCRSPAGARTCSSVSPSCCWGQQSLRAAMRPSSTGQFYRHLTSTLSPLVD